MFWFLRLLLGALLLGLDLGSKWLALHFLPATGIPIWSDWLGISFSLDFVTNTGTAWGLFANHPQLLFVFRVAVLAGLILHSLRSKGRVFPIWLVITGAAGNIIDTILYGHVIDFFHFTLWGYSFPVFNWADIYITLGIFALLIFGERWKKLRVG